ncbi:M16 family metallopeptidase [Olivibacter sitiensis]|uniref:M16 family metallopeptidase n=1 Tax=Olivibacter sitiensis TaxID=376470 RepID=UPI00041CB45C|nr:pitrilysin family protein [Olivibacter sitiensis]
MVTFDRFVLSNGLRVLVHEDPSTPMAAINILYNVGARDEDEERTGFAHLFEHLMFGGSKNVPQFDTALQRVGGESNAFTNNDFTNYYITLPAANMETAFWLESDRMLSLSFSEKSLDVQRQVVCEEFKQRYLNQPYGTAWLRLRPLAYQLHPYKWATIGKELKHIEEAKMEDVRSFFNRFYNPGNAIMVVAGHVTTEEVRKLAEKWFADIPGMDMPQRHLPQELQQTEARRVTFKTDVPANNIYIAFHMGDRLSEQYYAADLLSDILSRGTSSRLYRRLVKESQLFGEVNAYLLGSLDPGLFIVEGKPLAHVSIEEAEQAIWGELEVLRSQQVEDYELEKVKNKVESTMTFSEMSILDKAMNLAYFELLGDAGLLNAEVAKYRSISASTLLEAAKQIFTRENSSTLIYLAENHDGQKHSA